MNYFCPRVKTWSGADRTQLAESVMAGGWGNWQGEGGGISNTPCLALIAQQIHTYLHAAKSNIRQNNFLPSFVLLFIRFMVSPLNFETG